MCPGSCSGHRGSRWFIGTQPGAGDANRCPLTTADGRQNDPLPRDTGRRGQVRRTDEDIRYVLPHDTQDDFTHTLNTSVCVCVFVKSVDTMNTNTDEEFIFIYSLALPILV